MGETGGLWCMGGGGKPWCKYGKTHGEGSTLTVKLLLTCRYFSAKPLGRHLCQMRHAASLLLPASRLCMKLKPEVAMSCFVLGFKLILKINISFLLKLTMKQYLHSYKSRGLQSHGSLLILLRSFTCVKDAAKQSPACKTELVEGNSARDGEAAPFAFLSCCLQCFITSICEHSLSLKSFNTSLQPFLSFPLT